MVQYTKMGAWTCPCCRSYFDSGITTCPDCHGPLIDPFDRIAALHSIIQGLIILYDSGSAYENELAAEFARLRPLFKKPAHQQGSTNPTNKCKYCGAEHAKASLLWVHMCKEHPREVEALINKHFPGQGE